MATVRRVREVIDSGRGPGAHVLVDRLWPRGIAKADVPYDEWCTDVAPSSALRRWYGHDPARFDEFARAYRAELDTEPAASALARLREHARADGGVTLLTATRDVEHSHARVLADLL